MGNDNFKFIDKDALYSHIDGDEEILQMIAEEFLSNASSMMGDIRAAVQNSDPDALSHAAHSFKGAVSNFFAEAIREKAFKLEQMGRSGTTEGSESVFSEMEEEVSVFLEELKTLC
jgi:HPt (histidine-containing phosphotransfer) domain-containing protein